MIVSELPRHEYPRPQFVRDAWLCLNGPWQFESDPGDTGLERGLVGRELAERITVPFCVESRLSGIGRTDFVQAVWYRRRVTLPVSWSGHRLLLHFQAVDEEATFWVDGREVGRHRGGWTPVTLDVTEWVTAGEPFDLTVRARDDMRRAKPRGKQSARYANHGCEYTRTTGIWQTVWAEPVPRSYLQRARVTPSVDSGCFIVEQPVAGAQAGQVVRATLRDDSGVVARAQVRAARDLTPRLTLEVPASRRRLWSIRDPFLYDLELELLDGDGPAVDRVKSYAGLRGVSIQGQTVLLNGRAVFQRLVLDQGYYPDGIMTAPDDAALVRDIELAMQAGFNGARLHQKVFEERFLYHCDRLGYLVWGEFGDWGALDACADPRAHQPAAACLAQWMEVLERDYSHPSIIGWCPLNETRWPIEDRMTSLDDLTLAMFKATKLADATRPVIDASGYAHRVPQTDIYDSHLYVQDPEAFARMVGGLADGKPFINTLPKPPGDVSLHPGGEHMSVPYNGQPYFVSEFGGTWWGDPEDADTQSWGYGQRPETIEEFYRRFEGLCGVLLDDPRMFGYCYTQLTDVFQERNGLFTFDRRPKFDLARIAAVQRRPAAIEAQPLPAMALKVEPVIDADVFRRPSGDVVAR